MGDERVGVCPEQDLSRGRRLLEPLAERDRVAGDETGPAGRIARDDLARVDADPSLQGASLAELGSERSGRLEDGDGCPDSTQGVVFTYRRHAENGEQLVADELLDGSAVLLDDRRR